MKQLINYFLAFLLLTIFLVSCEKDIYDTKEVNCDISSYQDHPKANNYQAILDEYVSKGFPGISILVKDNQGTWVGSSGYADIDKGILFEPCHVSKAASITKLMVGTLTMKLVEDGVIGLDDAVSKYIEEDILKHIKYHGDLTIRHLMNHTTGIFDLITSTSFYLDVLNNPNKDWEPEELIKYVYDKEPYELTAEFPAHYSNTNTLILSMCINEAAGRKHFDLLRERILDPLGMNDTYYQSREDLPEITAQGYFDLHNVGELANLSNYITGSGNGYGGIFSNVFDLNKFLTALFIDKTLVTQESLDEMMEEFYLYKREPSGGTVSLALGIQKKFTHMPGYGIGHSGKDLGYSADMYYFPQGEMKFILFTNYGTDADSYLKPEFYDLEDKIIAMMYGS